MRALIVFATFFGGQWYSGSMSSHPSMSASSSASRPSKVSHADITRSSGSSSFLIGTAFPFSCLLGRGGGPGISSSFGSGPAFFVSFARGTSSSSDWSESAGRVRRAGFDIFKEGRVGVGMGDAEGRGDSWGAGEASGCGGVKGLSVDARGGSSGG